MRVDLHVHTRCSEDSLATPTEVLRWARRRAVDCVAITDHDTIEGALELHRLAPWHIIVGEEIRTTQGEIIGLFLVERIPPGLSPSETVRRVHAQHGLVYVPHPVDRVRHSVLALAALAEIVSDVDLIEVLNARVTFPLDLERAEDLARLHGLPRGAGSDAHQASEIGAAYLEMAPFSGPDEFVRNLHSARIGGRPSSPLVHVSSTYARLAKGLILATTLAK